MQEETTSGREGREVEEGTEAWEGGRRASFGPRGKGGVGLQEAGAAFVLFVWAGAGPGEGRKCAPSGQLPTPQHQVTAGTCAGKRS